MQHVIFDCETMSADAREAAVIDFSVFIFTEEKMLSDKPYSLDDHKNVRKFKLSLKNQVSQYKYKVSESTKQFWLEQSKEAQAHIKPLSDDLLLQDFSRELLLYLSTNCKSYRFDRWWTRSNTFDPVILQRIMDDTGGTQAFDKLCPHWLLRDTRSYIDGALSFPKENGFCPIEDEELWKRTFVLHDSAWDCLADALRIQAILRSQRGLTI